MDLLSQLAEVLNNNPCIVGVGNYLKNDDGVGPYIADYLAEELQSENITVINAEDIIESHVFRIAGLDCSTVLIIDAVQADAEPGSLLFGRLSELEGVAGGFSTHKMGLAVSGNLLERHGKRTYLLGIVAGDIDFGMDISSEVLGSADYLKDFIVKSVNCSQKELVHEH